MEFESQSNAVVVRLPMTEPTGKTRVKRPQEDAESAPVASRSAPMCDGDYLEWQISYYTEEEADASIVPGVILRQGGKKFYGREFIWLLAESRQIGILPQQRLEEALKIASTPPSGGFADEEAIVRTAAPCSGALTDSGFRLFNLRVPAFLKSAETYAVEIKVTHRQYAVGNQAMVFVHLPLSHCRPLGGREPFAGRMAEKKEMAEYRINAKNVGILSDIATAFLFASVKHRDDMRQLLEQIR